MEICQENESAELTFGDLERGETFRYSFDDENTIRLKVAHKQVFDVCLCHGYLTHRTDFDAPVERVDTCLRVQD